MSPKLQFFYGLCLLIATLVAYTNGEDRVSYRNYWVFRIEIAKIFQKDELWSIKADVDALIFLDDVVMTGKAVHVVVAPHYLPTFYRLLKAYGLWAVQVVSDLSQQLDRYGDILWDPSNALNLYSWKTYWPLNATYTWMLKFSESNAESMHLFQVGKTAENRDTVGALISRKHRTSRSITFPKGQSIGYKSFEFACLLAICNLYNWLTQHQQKKEEKLKPGIFIEAGIYGNDFISSAVATYLINLLTTSTYIRIIELTQKFDFYIVPHTNPDGYVHAYEVDPLWRKTRKIEGHCIGVDPNRNFGFQWRKEEHILTRCLYDHPGSAPFSEKETKQLSELITSLKDRIGMYVALRRSHDEFTITYPFDYTTEKPRDYGVLQSAVDAAKGFMDHDYMTNYSLTDNAPHSSGAGSSTDWVYGTKNIPTFKIMLAPSSKFNGKNLPWRQVPESEIQDIAEQALNAIAGLAQELQKTGHLRVPKN